MQNTSPPNTARWQTWVVERPIASLLATLMVLFAFAFGVSKLYFDGDYRVFFGPDNPQLQAFERMQNVYSKSDAVSFIIAPKSGNVFSDQTLSQIHQMTKESWQTPYSTRVDSITNFQHTRAEEDDLLVEDLLLETNLLSPDKKDAIRQVALTQPELLNKLVGENGAVTIINVTVQLPEIDPLTEGPAVAAFAKELKAKYEALYPDTDIRMSGLVMLNDAFATYAQSDSSTLVPGMFLAILLMLAFLLRSILSTIASLAVIIATIAATLGVSGWLGIPLTTPTVNVPTIVMTLAVADCVHIISSMLLAMRRGETKKQAIYSSLTINLRPVFITSATTAIGFLSLNFSDSPPLRDLGNLVAVGMLFAFLFSITLLPALLSLLPIKVKAQPNPSANMQRAALWVIKKQKQVLGFGVIIVAALASQVPNNQVNDDALKYFSTDTTFRQDSDFMAEHISGMTSLEFGLDSGMSNGINDPAFLKQLAEFTAWLRAQPETDHVLSLSDTIKRLNKNMHGDDNSQYRLPDEKELAAQYLLMYEMSLPYGLDLNNQINIDKSATRVVATFKNLGSTEILALEHRADAWFQQHAPNLQVDIASTSSMFAHVGERNMSSMLIGTAFALVLISALLGVALRSWRLGFISLLPNILPGLAGFGLWSLVNGEINLALSIVSSLTLGIVVDDTVHFLSKYQHARKQGQDTEQSVIYAFTSVGRALLITTLVICIGFGILTQSNFAMNADMGLLTSIVVMIALLIDLLILPAFLLVFDRKPKLASNTKTSNSEPQLTSLANS
ncbi:efflux RND transporter permease subunit [Motilimonas sp. 1_MG-2023]|uniref:efflux RND transporter permease subunit n=1 Tax=Motilimonas TaxID=1914248 RepID=UPI0026E41D79|nr:MMPL family transporter [Motilimonas sp. 1_MG-2023]MDO6524913.1 MMPL family transporter [Motilimonas sp. 1_MG-2023]